MILSKLKKFFLSVALLITAICFTSITNANNFSKKQIFVCLAHVKKSCPPYSSHLKFYWQKDFNCVNHYINQHPICSQMRFINQFSHGLPLDSIKTYGKINVVKVMHVGDGVPEFYVVDITDKVTAVNQVAKDNRMTITWNFPQVRTLKNGNQQLIFERQIYQNFAARKVTNSVNIIFEFKNGKLINFEKR